MNIPLSGSVSQTYGEQLADGSVNYWTGSVGNWQTFSDGHLSVNLFKTVSGSYQKRVMIYTSGYYNVSGAWGWWESSSSYYSWSYGTSIAYYDTLENPFA